jgi:hypothetical protein
MELYRLQKIPGRLRVLLFWMLAISVLSPSAAAEDVALSGGILVLSRFEHPVVRSYWAEVLSELRRLLPQKVLAHAEWRQVTPGEEVSYVGSHVKVLEISFQGNCDEMDQEGTATPGPLGWVFLVNGEIEPFIHISCQRIAESVYTFLLAQPPPNRQQLMARATARVLAHEILHVVNQSVAHTSTGVQKSCLSPRELLQLSPP